MQRYMVFLLVTQTIKKMTILLSCKPTGRASKRLQESTGLEAMTIHRLIGWNQETQPEDILDNEIKAKLIIIDEMSMVDTWLFHQFLSAVP